MIELYKRMLTCVAYFDGRGCNQIGNSYTSSAEVELCILQTQIKDSKEDKSLEHF